MTTDQTADQMIRSLVDARIANFLDYDVFIGNDGGESVPELEVIRQIQDAWLADHSDLDKIQRDELRAHLSDDHQDLFAVCEDANFHIGYLVGLELGRRLGGAR